MYAICAAEIDTAPPDADGHMNLKTAVEILRNGWGRAFSGA
jgi:L-asparaginase/Glu-tRNA(Gln) amidotransferase subunit D